MSTYEFSTSVPVRYRDLDPMKHVNNAVYVTYLEQARAEYLESVVGHDGDFEMVVASLEIQYRESIRFRDDVVVNVRVSELGKTSFTMEYEIVADGTVAAEAETVQVAMDGSTGAPQPVPTDWRDAFVSYEGLDVGSGR